jgi:TolB-like protein
VSGGIQLPTENPQKQPAKIPQKKHLTHSPNGYIVPFEKRNPKEKVKKMKKRCFFYIGCKFFLCLFIISSSWAGQVVTQDIRGWAKKVLEEEKTLQALEGKNTVAVLYFQNKTNQSDLDPLEKGLTLMLITDLSKVRGLQVIERVRLQALTEEIGLGTTGLVAPGAAPRVGRLLGAQWIVGGEILKDQPDQLNLQSNPLEVPTQKILGQLMTGGKLEELFRMEKDLLFEIVKLLKIDIKPIEHELRKPCSTNLKGLMALFRAIDASDHKDYESAAEFYQKAMKEDPGMCIARDAVKELELLKLTTARRSRTLLRSLREETSQTDKRELRPTEQPKPRPCLNCP